MLIRQISVFVENRKGRLYSLAKTLADNGIDLKALSISDTSEFGILRSIVNDPKKALQVVKDAGFTASVTEVLGIEVEDEPGGLAKVLDILNQNDISVEYLYSFVGTCSDNALIIFRVEETEKAFELLKNSGLKILTEEMIYNI
ncbi:MAG: ACT domain-containing protein [Christensenella sp.]|uniref:ACT domain-containing protein n=1 Tax=Christensenella sp. TaxID=1935934 RepID=UPI002B20A178|nr:ACT domain-containing protein [Christensenella sp.]MEA5003718.1 ACT domain-containing protein [Christensenella sp.]